MNLLIFDVNLLTATLIPTVLLGMSPYIFQLWGHDAELPRTVAELLQRYTWGTGSILAGYITWLYLIDRAVSPLEAAAGLVIVALAGGAIVVFRYVSDWAAVTLRNTPLYQEAVKKLERARN